MRRMHWWGAAAGVSALAVAAVAAPAAYAAPPKPTTMPAVAKPGPAPAKRPGHGHHHHHKPPCPYPPHGAADVSINARDGVRLNQPLVITGALKVNGCGYEQFAAALYRFITHRQHQPDEWVRLQTTTTGSGGAMSFTLAPRSSGQYRIMTAGKDGVAEGVSATKTVGYRSLEHH